MTQLTFEFARVRIPNYPDYSIDQNGTVYGKNGEPMIGDATDGYRKVSLGGKREYIHRLVLLTFVGPCPEGFQACHKNSDRADNRLSNLTWGSRKRNARDRKKLGYFRQGLTPAEKQRAQILYEQGYSFEKLTKEFNVDGRTLRRYAKRYQWRRVETLRSNTNSQRRQGTGRRHTKRVRAA
ncbi:HNH endonuclease [Allocoleopsis sp.]|uniref:HNH endonuclease n=1 Tax=Allocoleopsis sp. TaxID=3088169 RepID=UPI002FCE82F0